MLRKIAVPIVACIVFLCLWEALVWVNGWPNYVMASPSDLPASY
ncbi:MAG: ABC transporter permease, partial [Pseudomonadota bacterium]